MKEVIEFENKIDKQRELVHKIKKGIVILCAIEALLVLSSFAFIILGCYIQTNELRFIGNFTAITAILCHFRIVKRRQLVIAYEETLEQYERDMVV